MTNKIANLIHKFNNLNKFVRIPLTVLLLLVLSPFLIVYAIVSMIMWGNPFGV